MGLGEARGIVAGSRITANNTVGYICSYYESSQGEIHFFSVKFFNNFFKIEFVY